MKAATRETDLRQIETIAREKNQMFKLLQKQQNTLSRMENQKIRAQTEQENFQFKIRTHRRFTPKNIVEMSKEIKSIRNEIAELKEKESLIQRLIDEMNISRESLFKPKVNESALAIVDEDLKKLNKNLFEAKSNTAKKENDLNTLLSRTYDYDFCQEFSAQFAHSQILTEMLQMYEKTKETIFQLNIDIQ